MKLIQNLFVLAVGLMSAVSANAATLTFGTNDLGHDIINSVSGLTIDGTEYQATFYYDTNFNNFYSSNPEIAFWGDSTMNNIAAGLLMDQLGSDVAVTSYTSHSYQDILYQSDTFFVPYRYSGSNIYGHGDKFSALDNDDLGEWYHPSLVGYFYPLSDAKINFVVFTEASAVPVPGAIWLLGSGFAGLVGLRKRKK